MERRKLSLVGILALLVTAVAMACTSSKTPATPVAPTTSSATTGSDGSTLKVSKPAVVSPVGDVQLTGQNPVLTVQGAAGTFVPGDSAIQYDFELYDANGVKVQTGVVSTTTYLVVINLDFGKRYTWRARAAIPSQNAYGPWSDFASFVSPQGGYIRGNEIFDPLYNGL